MIRIGDKYIIECLIDVRSATYGALATQTLDLAVRVDLVVLQDRHLDLFALVLDLLGGVVGLLFALLGATTETMWRIYVSPSHSYNDERVNVPKHQVQGRLLLDVVVAQSAAILKLLASEDETLLVGGNAAGSNGRMSKVTKVGW